MAEVAAPPVVTLRDVAATCWAGLDDVQAEAACRIEDVVDFDGPRSALIGDTAYISLTQYGVKEEGHSVYPDSDTRCWTEAEAIWRFKRTMRDYLLANPSRQLAWRVRPFVERGLDGDYLVRCRFALLGCYELPTKVKAVA